MNCNKFKPLIRAALREDIGRRDITTEIIAPKNKQIRAVLLAKENMVVCGLDVAREVFKQQNPKVIFRPLVKDGSSVRTGKILARIEGNIKDILTAERVALNFLGLLSGIATSTRKYVDAIRQYRVKIVDTRKTIPFLRELEKYAVRVGGGYNHRIRLDEMVLVKDNHINSAGCRVQGAGLKDIIERVKAKAPRGIKIEIEVENLKQFREALKGRPDIIMLDNMSIEDMKRAVNIKRTTSRKLRATELEASGSVTLKNIKKVASTGVDMISIGALTHSVKTTDISLEVA